MAIYTIADLHLSTHENTNKSMEVFGKRWDCYIERIENNWRRLISNEDTVVIPGDVSWALSLEEATSDLKFLDSLPGKKIIGKGNHDFWWCTMKKHREHFEKNSITSISFLFNNAYETDEFIIAGTRGWFYDEKNASPHNKTDFAKLTAREELRLETSLKAAKTLSEASGKEIVVFMHFPPVWGDEVCDGLIEILLKYNIRRVYFGHIHGNYTIPQKSIYRDIELCIISADYLSFIPQNVPKR